MKRKTIRNHKDFFIADNALSVRVSWGIIKAGKAKIQDDARYGIIATKKNFKFATQRNRVKRKVRDWIAFNENNMLPDLDYVFILRQEIIDTLREDGRLSMKKALIKISKKHITK